MQKRPLGLCQPLGDPLAAHVGSGDSPEGSVVALGDTAGSVQGSFAVLVLPADSSARLEHGPDLRVFRVSVVLWVLP